MPATVTLSTTTLQFAIGTTDSQINVASTAGLSAGTRLWVDRELMTVISLAPDPWVNVQRGVDGTAATPHNSQSTVTIGRADQFYASDPVGRPPEAIVVSPYINVVSGDVWFAQGDSNPNGQNRWWQKQTATYSQGPLSVRTTTLDPTSST